MALRFAGSEFVPMDDLTFMWVQITHFTASTPADDRALISELIRSPQYAFDYASPFEPEAAVVEPAVHGRWWRGAVHAGLFQRCSAVDAEAVLHSWCNDQDWTPPDYQPSEDARGRLAGVCALLRVGDVYALQNPGGDVEHDYGCVTGGLGFHEFVVLDHANRDVHLIVASDD